MQSAIDGLSLSQGGGAEAISTHGQQFLEAVKIVAQKTAAERDRLAEELEEVKKMRDEHLKEGLDVLRTQKDEEKEEKLEDREQNGKTEGKG